MLQRETELLRREGYELFRMITYKKYISYLILFLILR